MIETKSGFYRRDGIVAPSLCDASFRLGIWQQFSLIQDIAAEHAERLGVGGAAMTERGAFWLAVHTRLEFFEKADMMKPLSVSTWPVRTAPEDLRKPALAHLMALAEGGAPEAEEIFRRIGRNLSAAAREMDWIFGKTPPIRFLFGRFVKSPRCFALLREGFDGAGTGLRLEAADEELANTPLMRQLAAREDVTVAQFGQAVGAVYFAML